VSQTQDLKQVVDAGAAVWITLSSRNLNQALERSGSNAATHLREFCIRVQEWLHEKNAKEDSASPTFAQRRDWVEKVAGAFLAELDVPQIENLAQQLSSGDERIEWLEILLYRGIRDRLQPAIITAGQLVAQEAPSTHPEIEHDAKAWPGRIGSLIHLAARSAQMKNAAEPIAGLLAPLPSWMIKDIFRLVGELRAFGTYDLELALALPLIDVGVIVPPFAAAWKASGGQHRLARLLWLLGEHGHTSRQDIPSRLSLGTLPTSDKIEEFLASVDQNLHAVDSGDAALVRNWIESAKRQDDEQVHLFAAYLNAVPRYPHHEHVMDCLSVYREPMVVGIRAWGLPEVTVGIRSSMTSSSLNLKPESKIQFDPPDFAAPHVYTRICAESAAKLVLDQPSQEFAIEYLLQLKHAKNPAITLIIKEVFGNAGFNAKLRAARDTMAATMLANLGTLFEYGIEIDAETSAAIADLLQKIIHSVPSKNLSIRPIYELARLTGQPRLVESEVIRRLQTAKSATEVYDLLQDEFITRATTGPIFDKLDIAPFLPPMPLDNGALEKWATNMVHLHYEAPRLTSRILAQCTVEFFEQMAISYKYFGIVTDEIANWVNKRMSFKLQAYQQWAVAAPSSVARHLQAHIQRDFELWFWCGIRVQQASKNSEPMLEEKWLDLIDSTVPDLVDVYLDGVLRHARPGLGASDGPTIADAIVFATSWLAKRQRAASPRLWEVLEKRIIDAESNGVANDIEFGDLPDQEIVAIGSAKLPGPPERLRSIREKATRVLRARYGANPLKLQHWHMKRFVEILRNDAPDLHAELLGHATAK